MRRPLAVVLLVLGAVLAAALAGRPVIVAWVALAEAAVLAGLCVYMDDVAAEVREAVEDSTRELTVRLVALEEKLVRGRSNGEDDEAQSSAT